MITPEQQVEAWKDRMGQRCRCGAKKPQGHPFCAACWAKLPGPLQYALQEHLTKNFNDRYFEAVELLAPKVDDKSLKDCQRDTRFVAALEHGFIQEVDPK